jgi:hypothetical protein
MTRIGAPEGAHAAVSRNDFQEDTAIQEAKHRVRAALRLQAHGMASGEIRPTDLSEAIMRLLAVADDWLSSAGARRAV